MAYTSLEATIGDLHERKAQFDAEYELDSPEGPAKANPTTTTTTTTTPVVSCVGC